MAEKISLKEKRARRRVALRQTKAAAKAEAKVIDEAPEGEKPVKSNAVAARKMRQKTAWPKKLEMQEAENGE